MTHRDFVKQLHTKSEAELRKEITAERGKLWQLRIDLKAGKIKNVADIQKTKKAIAGMLTALRMRFTNDATK